MSPFDATSGFWNMGGYAAFIWPSYGLWAIAIAGLLWYSLARRAGARAHWARLSGNEAEHDES